ncbi:MAG: hypothetical protein OQK82_07355, partial [Candidatus Pacearchaeota archaeon]|nr:hypothetical protein [Candidatus Pacearchaeota archaeon]
VDVEIYYANFGGIPTKLDVYALADGAVCFAGRDPDANPVLRLIMTEHSCDGIIDAIAALDEDQVSNDAQQAFSHVRTTTDLRHILTSGINLKGIGKEKWSYIKSLTGVERGVPNMGLMAWNYAVTGEALKKKDLNKAGVILLVKDCAGDDVPGLDAAIRNGLIQPDASGADPE